MRTINVSALVGMLVLAFAVPSAAEPRRPMIDLVVPPHSTVQELRLADGSLLYGRVEQIADSSFEFRTLGGEVLQVARERVQVLRIVKGAIVSGEFRPRDPNATRLFFAPTARALEKGEGYLGIYEFLMPFAQAGLSDRVSLGGGTPLIFGLGGHRPFWITPKIQVVRTTDTQAAIGALHLFGPEGESVGIAYGVVTRGTRDNALTVGVGRTYASGSRGTTLVMVGGERRLTRTRKFVTENYVSQDVRIASGGMRFMGDKFTCDVGLGVILGDHLYTFPVLNFAWKF